MNRNIVLSLATAAAIALTTPALAGAPDDPHERRDLVQANQDVQTELNGASGFGQRVAWRNTNKSGSDPFRNFGDYLKRMTDGPDAGNDQGSGND